MFKNKLFLGIVSAFGTIIVTSLVLIIIMLANPITRNNTYEVEFNSDKTKVISFEALDVLPGESSGYVLKLKPDVSGIYKIVLDFEEIEGSNLKEYLRVQIVIDDDVIYDDILGKSFLEDITFDYEFDNKNFKDLNIVYYIPDEVGNEVANATASFELNLTGRLK